MIHEKDVPDPGPEFWRQVELERQKRLEKAGRFARAHGVAPADYALPEKQRDEPRRPS